MSCLIPPVVYSISEFPDGTYQIYLDEVPGYPRVYAAHKILVTIEDGQMVEGIDFEVEQGIVIKGKVVDAEGQPVKSARVGVYSEVLWGAETGYTKADGTFVVALTTPLKECFIQASKDNYESEVVGPFPLTQEGLQGLELKLTVPRTASVSGIVVNEAGAALEGVNISMSRGISDYMLSNSQGESGADGLFRLENLAPGEYSIRLTKPGAMSRGLQNKVNKTKLLVGEQATGLRLVLARKGNLAISGVVLDTKGEPIDDVGVEVRSDRSFVMARTNETGHFSITGLADAEYNVFVHHRSYTSAPVERVSAGDDDIVIVMQGKASIEGKVLRADTDEPISNFELFFTSDHVQQLDHSMFNRGKQTYERHLEDGFKVSGLAVGDATLTARAPGFAPGFVSDLVLVENETLTDVEIMIEPSKPLSGYVTNWEGEPVSGAMIYLGKIPLREDRHNNVVSRSDVDGMFSIDSFSSDISLISCFHPDYAPVAVRPEDDCVIVLHPAATLEGIVLDGDVPMVRTSVLIYYNKESSLYGSYYEAYTGQDGTFMNDELPVGTADVTAVRELPEPETISQSVELVAGETAYVELRFEPPS